MKCQICGARSTVFMPNPIDDLRAISKKFESEPKPPVGIVFRAALKESVEKRFNSLPNSSTPLAFGVPIFFDLHQSEDCVMFYDHKLLSLYLNRRENEEAWTIALAEEVIKTKQQGNRRVVNFGSQTIGTI